jgi:hypothetical protein
MRALKRQLCNIVLRHMNRDLQRRLERTGPPRRAA